MSAMLNEVLEAFESEGAERADVVPRDQVRRWALSDDIEVMGALFSFLDDAKFRARIQPPLSFDEHQAFFLRYFERCLLENPRSEWACSRYEAGWSMIRWFHALWKDEAVPRRKLLEIKRLLERLYKAGDKEIRICIINATLEHLFQNRKIATYFNDWKNDPLLAQAYAAARFWKQDGGSDLFGVEPR